MGTQKIRTEADWDLLLLESGMHSNPNKGTDSNQKPVNTRTDEPHGVRSSTPREWAQTATAETGAAMNKFGNKKNVEDTVNNVSHIRALQISPLRPYQSLFCACGAAQSC